MQQKTGRPVQFELLPDARASLLAWLDRRGGTVDDYVFPSRVDHSVHLSTRQYARLAAVIRYAVVATLAHLHQTVANARPLALLRHLQTGMT